MAGIPSPLNQKVRTILLNCAPFDDNRQLRAIFADQRLSPWRNRLPEATSFAGRIDALIAFLHDKQRSDTGENGLVLLLQVLSERIDPADACHQQLATLAHELAAALAHNQPSPTAPPPTTTTPAVRGRFQASKTPPNLPLNPIQNRWAFLVGINRYNDPVFAPLKYCVNDVVGLQKLLQQAGYSVVTLHDDAPEARLKPTKDNVLAELTAVCQAVQPDDLLYVHFACHGQLVNNAPYLIMQQTRARIIPQSGLILATVEKTLRDSPARRLIMTLDACHVGVDIGRGQSDPNFNRYVYDQAEGFALIAASTAQQKAQEWDKVAYGVFSYYLMEGLRGAAATENKAFVTVSDIANYVLGQLRHWNVLHGGLLQEPTAYTEGLGDMIFVDYRPKHARR